MIDKKIVITVAIITILIVAIVIGIKVKSLNEKNYTFDILNSGENKVVEENIVNQVKTDTENTTNTENEVNEISEENVVNNGKTTNQESQEKKLTGEELAKSLAQKEWGEDKDVYFYLEEKVSDDVYIISVRSKDTTKGLIDYEVNIKTGKVSEY